MKFLPLLRCQDIFDVFRQFLEDAAGLRPHSLEMPAKLLLMLGKNLLHFLALRFTQVKPIFQRLQSQGAVAFGTITTYHRRRRMARPGKLTHHNRAGEHAGGERQYECRNNKNVFFCHFVLFIYYRPCAKPFPTSPAAIARPTWPAIDAIPAPPATAPACHQQSVRSLGAAAPRASLKSPPPALTNARAGGWPVPKYSESLSKRIAFPVRAAVAFVLQTTVARHDALPASSQRDAPSLRRAAGRRRNFASDSPPPGWSRPRVPGFAAAKGYCHPNE